MKRKKEPVCLTCGHAVTGKTNVPACLTCQFSGGQYGGHSNGSGWPMKSDALGCHPSQVNEHNERAKRHGINVKYDSEGFCHIPDRGVHRDILNLEKMHINNSFTGY